MGCRAPGADGASSEGSSDRRALRGELRGLLRLLAGLEAASRGPLLAGWQGRDIRSICPLLTCCGFSSTGAGWEAGSKAGVSQCSYVLPRAEGVCRPIIHSSETETTTPPPHYSFACHASHICEGLAPANPLLPLTSQLTEQ